MIAERRELTILFCDVLGSTAMAEQLPLDDFITVIQTYHKCVSQEINIQYGYVAQYLGDGVMAYFGYPVVFKNAATNAIKAGLQLVKSIRGLQEDMEKRFGIELKIRISIHTGIVVMADLGIGQSKERLALGEPPNIAARLQAIAPENGVVVSQSTYELAKNHFDFKSLGQHALKGVSEHMSVYQALGVC
jgi:class 3 adenylate cyclase